MKTGSQTLLSALLVIANAWLASETLAISLTRGPYIQMGHFTNQTTVVWRTDVSADSWVDYGLTPSYGATVNGASSDQHEVTLTGLLPGTNYYYRVRSSGVNLASDVFASGKAPGMPFRIGITGDHRGGGGGGVGSRMATVKPDLILDTGDVTDSCDFNQLDAQFFTKFWQVFRYAPFYWTPGNHEGNNCSYCLNAFLLPPDERNYWFEYADAQIVSLSSEGLPGTTWLANALAASSKPWKIVFFHQPARTSASNHGENATIRDQYVPIMEQYRVDACFNGHNHFYWRSLPINGITHAVVGSGGAPRYTLGTMPCYSAYGNGDINIFAYADIDGDQMYIRAMDENGNQVDEALIDHACPFQLDGLLDPMAVPVASRAGGLSIWASIAGRYLYVATQDAGEGNDNFIFVARTQTGTMTNLWSWSKTGNVMAYDAFVADENDNTYSGWFKADGNAFGNIRVARSGTRWCNGNYLEAVIDLQNLYGEIPVTLYLAAAPYGTANGGALSALAQCPAGNGDGNIDPNEFVAVNTAGLVTPFLLDGVADHPGYLIADSNGMKLWAAVYGELLYVATWSPGNYPGDNTKNDHFIVVADQLTSLQPAFPAWSKAGLNAVSTNAPFLGGESINNYIGWQSTTATVQAAKSPTNSGQMEGTINLREAFGSIPPLLYIAVAPYATTNGGALIASAQVPAGNGNGNIESNEFLTVPVTVIRDDNLDGTFDSLDPSRGFVVQQVEPTGGGYLLIWPCIPAHTNRVYYTDNLTQGFQPLSGNLVAAQGQFSMSYTDNTASVNRFYRVQLLSP